MEADPSDDNDEDVFLPSLPIASNQLISLYVKNRNHSSATQKKNGGRIHHYTTRRLLRNRPTEYGLYIVGFFKPQKHRTQSLSNLPLENRYTRAAPLYSPLSAPLFSMFRFSIVPLLNLVLLIQLTETCTLTVFYCVYLCSSEKPPLPP